MPNKAQVQIRSALRSDLDFLVESQIKMAFETEGGMQLELSVVQKGVTAVFDDPRKGEYFVVLIDENPVACLLTIPEWSDWRNGNVLWIHSLYVIPTERGKGRYRELYEYLQAKVASSPPYRGLRLYVDKRNKAAQKVYQKLGMSNDHYEMFEWMKGE